MKYDFQIHDADTDNKRLVWSLKGNDGGVHIWAQFTDVPIMGKDFYGGVEVHYPKPPYEFSPLVAPIKDCWLLGGDCWCDGSSLYFEDNIAPMLDGFKGDPENLTEFMNSELLSWYKSHLNAHPDAADIVEMMR